MHLKINYSLSIQRLLLVFVIVSIFFLSGCDQKKSTEVTSENKPLENKQANESEASLASDKSKKELLSKDIKLILKEGVKYDQKLYPKILSIYNLDVFSYFSLNEKYDSDLKKETFKETTDYVTHLSKLKDIRLQETNKFYYIVMEDKFIENKYDINKNGFSIGIGSNWGIGTNDARAPKSIDGICFLSLPAFSSPMDYLGQGTSGGMETENIFIPINKEEALKIENNPKTVIIYLIFKINGVDNIEFKYLSISTQEWFKIKQVLLISDAVRIVIMDKPTGYVYYDNVI